MAARQRILNGALMVSNNELAHELVTHFRDNRKLLLEQWAHQMAVKGLLTGLTTEETEAEANSVYEAFVVCLDTGGYDGATRYAATAGPRAVRTMTAEQVIGGLFMMRDIQGRSLLQRYQGDAGRLAAALDCYESVADGILSIVALAFIEEREKVVRQQQEAIRELSTPVLQLREGLLILPVIGVIDSQRARQLTEQLLQGIRQSRGKIVVMDITGVANVDSKVANHIVQTVDACRLLGATCIVTGVAPQIAQTLVTIGVDLTKMNTVGDLQGGIEEADRLLGYRTILADGALPRAVPSV